MNNFNSSVLKEKGSSSLFNELEEEIPQVFFSAEVIRAIEYIVQCSDKEVAWLGLVDKIDMDYLVYKIYIPTQTVTASTVDIEANAITDLTMQIMDEGYDPSHLRYHGHSHVNMSIHPSSVDQTHMKEYIEHADFFIREIRNKKEENRVDIFDRSKNRIYHCVDTDIYELLRPQEFYDDIDAELRTKIKKQVSFLPYSKHTATYAQKNTPQPVRNDVIAYEDLLKDPFFVSDGYAL